MGLVVSKATDDTSAVGGAAGFRRLMEEAIAALEIASVALESLSNHRGVESRDFERLAEFVGNAQGAVERLADAHAAPPKTIFPNQAMAHRWCERHPLADGLCYQIHPDGMGRCAVSINVKVLYL
jgi:hypothetical protein